MYKKILLLLTLSILSCDTPFTPEYTLAWEPPVINSVTITSAASPSIVKEITFNKVNHHYYGSSKLIDFETIKNFYIQSHINTEQKNKKLPQTTISFTIPEASHVKISIMAARLPFEEKGTLIQRFTGSVYVKLRSGGIIITDQPYTAGSHSVAINANEIPSGAYVMILQSDKFNAVRNMLLYHNCEETVPELRPYILDCSEKNY